MPELPWVKFDLFAYQVGVSRDLPAALELLREGFQQELEMARKAGLHNARAPNAQGEFAVATHALTAKGWRARFDMEKPEGVLGSLVYIFYRPPFALKVRASFPGYAPAETDAAIDDAVRELLPNIEVVAAAACADRNLEVGVPADYEALPEAERKRALVIGLAVAMLQLSLDGCQDLEAALRVVDIACKKTDALCGQPPWAEDTSADPSTTDS